jgi:hypothetical protein
VDIIVTFACSAQQMDVVPGCVRALVDGLLDHMDAGCGSVLDAPGVGGSPLEELVQMFSKIGVTAIPIPSGMDKEALARRLAEDVAEGDGSTDATGMYL